MSCHDIIRNRWVTQMLTDMEYIEYLEDELCDKKDINADDYEQALREVDRLIEDVHWYEEEIVDLLKEIDLLEGQNSELIDEIENLSSEISLLRYKYE